MQILLKELIRDYEQESTGCCRSRYFSRQSRLPCSYLNSNDMILGSAEKIAGGLSSVMDHSDSDIVMIDTLGASMQVTDEIAAIKSTGASERVLQAGGYLSGMDMYEGFDDTIEKIVEHICDGDTDVMRGSVNVLGYGMFDSGWEFGTESIRSMIMSAGATSVRFIGCGCGVSEVKESQSAEFNVLIHPEASTRTAEYYHREFGIPYIIPKMGSPIGYPSIFSFLDEISSFMGHNADAASGEVEEEKVAVDKMLMNQDKILNEFRGAGMSLTGIASDVYPLMEWLFSHLTLVPEQVTLTGVNDTHRRCISDMLSEIGCEDIGSDPRVVLTDGMSAAYGKMSGSDASFIPISMPYSSGVSLVDRSLVGTHGCRYILDEILNGIGRFVCGQPTMADFR